MSKLNDAYAKEELPGEYLHSFHAGNVGDVWKHIVLLSVLAELLKAASPLTVMDCYAGAGGYQLHNTGEWKEGIAALLVSKDAALSSAVSRYIKIVEAGYNTKRSYMGSPLLIEALLRDKDSLHCHETHSETRKSLSESLNVGRSKIFESDGLKGLLALSRETALQNTAFLALVDPPWIKKEDWQTVPQVLVEAWQSNPLATLLLWYPIKSYTRVNTMIKYFQSAKLPAAILDLITTPLEHQRNRLNGSGLILVNGSTAMISEISAAANYIGRACATQGRSWSFRASEI